MLERRDRVVIGLLVLVNLTAVAWFFAHWAGLPDWSVHPVMFAIASLIVLYRLGGYAVHWALLPFMRTPGPAPRLERPLRVGVATTFVPASESLAMLERTVRSLVEMEGGHDTWVLDEGDDARVREMCRDAGARYFTRRGHPHYNTDGGPFRARTKYGNYNAWLDSVGFDAYDAIVTFDPDHVPSSDYLTETLGYLVDEDVAFVQPPQVYYNQRASMVARGAAEETYAYYSSGQMAAYGMGYPIVTGCHTVHRSTALEEIGGLPAHDADDLLSSLLYRTSGWRGVYVPRILARGLTPVDWHGYLRQQRRWARSVLDIKLREWPRRVGRMPFRERVFSGLHGLYYVRGLSSLAEIMLLGFMAATGIIPAFVSYTTGVHALAMFGTLVVTDFYRQRFYLDRRREWGLHWRASLLQLAKWPQLVVAVWQVLRGVDRPFVVTPKTLQAGDAGPPTLLTRPHLATLGFFAVCVALGLAFGRDVHPLVYVGIGVMAATIGILLGTAMRVPPPAFDPAIPVTAPPE
ncbi:MAG: glycosyltransferase [Gemmatimonadota bacterium]|nr:glycosyltransferase [Gemmatimonadota bacterium]